MLCNSLQRFAAEGGTDPFLELARPQRPRRLDDGRLPWTHLGSIAFSHGLFMGKKQDTIRTPRSA